MLPASPVAKSWHAGTHRLIPPADTVSRLRPLMPVMGITRIADVTGLDHIGIPVVMVCRPNARSLSVSQGKGLDVDAARASGLMESVEFHHAERITLPLKLASLSELRYTHAMAELGGLPRYAKSAFHDQLRILWIEGRDLVSGRGAWLPYEMVHMSYTLPLPSGSGCFFMSSSGLASGNHRLEALSHALCELVEHDATTLWHCLSDQARHATRIDPDTIDDPACRALLDRYARARIEVAIWDTTSDVGIASFNCTIFDVEPDPARPVPAAGGLGCHPARDVALARALTEAAQSRLTLIAGSRDDIRPASYKGTQAPEVLERLRAYVRVQGALRSFLSVPTKQHATLDDDVAWELGRLAAVGLGQALVVDLTRAEFGIPVVRVIVPGLEILHDSPGYLPGPRARRRLAERRA